MTKPDYIDPLLAEQGDSRNVIDQYKNWHIDAIRSDLAKKAFDVHIAIENYQHDYNIGSIVRSANAFNVAGVHIVGKRHWNRRGAMATEKYIEVYHHSSLEDFAKWSSIHKLINIGIDNITDSVDLHKTKLPLNCMLIFGQEGPGLSVEMQNICTKIVAVEQFGSTRSVNVGVAAGIVLYDWVRQNVL